MNERAQLEVQMLNEARAEVSIADQKASVILAGAGIGFSAILGGLLAGDWRPSDYDMAGQILWWLGAILALGVIAAAALALWPRFTTQNEESLVTYWGHVARYRSLADFEAALADSPIGRDRTRHQLWRLASIVRRKYQCIRAALASGGVAVILFVLAGIFG